ncbi:hypothetical protein [Prescottella agglutinans]|uniref:Uncharacterized protein n=1 Tax=Prescottella agglutinans TaxID=1644129 RepID=A0ABT6M5D0_9NOCA|nr:hypothetical protein [Prescottella agglutinans]MDH6279507.1 hypothetical protein [Prescottella agglutinans]
MSTAEQIIAEHRWDERRGICECMFVPEFGPGTRYERMTLKDHAAHVVAALTNAGKTIVDLPEADEVVHGIPYWSETDIEVHKSVIMRDGFPVTAERLRIEAGDFLAAARVAEGGER